MMKRLLITALCLAMTVTWLFGCAKEAPADPEPAVEETAPAKEPEVAPEEEEDISEKEEEQEPADEEAAEDESGQDGTYEIPEEEQVDKPMGGGGGPGPDYEGE